MIWSDVGKVVSKEVSDEAILPRHTTKYGSITALCQTKMLNNSNNKIHSDCRVASSMPQQSNHERKKSRERTRVCHKDTDWKGMKTKKSTKDQQDEQTYIAVGHKDGIPILAVGNCTSSRELRRNVKESASKQLLLPLTGLLAQLGNFVSMEKQQQDSPKPRHHPNFLITRRILDEFPRDAPRH